MRVGRQGIRNSSALSVGQGTRNGSYQQRHYDSAGMGKAVVKSGTADLLEVLQRQKNCLARVPEPVSCTGKKWWPEVGVCN